MVSRGTILWNYFQFRPVFQEEILVKIFHNCSFGGPFVQRSGTICANCGSVYQEDQFCEIILNLDQWFRRRCCLKDFLSGALAALLCSGAEPFMQFWKGASWEHSYEVIWNSDHWFRRCCLKKKFKDRRTTDDDHSQNLTLSLWLRWAKYDHHFMVIFL